MITKTDWAYIAGIMDGEGCITMGFCRSKSRKSVYYRCMLQINVTNTNKELVYWLSDKLGGKVYIRPHKNPNHRTTYVWYVMRKTEREKFLLGILPYLKIKIEQANLALQWIRLEGQDAKKRRFLTAQIQQLNRPKSLTTNTPDTLNRVMIESELTGDSKSYLQ